MANICPQSGHTNVLIKASLQKGATLAGSLVAKGRRIYMEQKEKRNLRGTRNAPRLETLLRCLKKPPSLG